MKLSIITINKNNAEGLCKTIESVISQTDTNYEYIIIDGGSCDGSTDVIREYQDKIFYWVSEPDSGIYNAMNKGIQKAKGEYCLFLNSGDYLCNKDVLRNVFRYNLKDDIVYGHQYIEVEEKLIEDVCLDIHYYSFRTLKNAHIPHQSTFIKRSLFDKIGFYFEEYKIISDWAFVMLALFKYDATIARISEYITVYDTQGISSIEIYKELQEKERQQFLLKYFKWFMIDYEAMERFEKKWYVQFIYSLRNIKNKFIRKS